MPESTTTSAHHTRLEAIATVAPAVSLTDALAIDGALRNLPVSKVHMIRDLTRLTGCTISEARDAIERLTHPYSAR